MENTNQGLEQLTQQRRNFIKDVEKMLDDLYDQYVRQEHIRRMERLEQLLNGK